MQVTKVIIIGSGVAGLATSIRLAAAGYEVAVYEKNDFPGGKLSLFEQDGFRFDAGPSLFTEPELIEELFELAGKKTAAYFEYHKVDITCNYFFSNGKKLKAAADNRAFSSTVAKELGEKEDAVYKYLERARSLYDNIGSIFLNFSLHKSSTWLHPRIFKALKTIRWPYLFSTLNRHNERSFKNKETVQLFNRYATYNGSNPYTAPGMLSLIPHLEFNKGTFYPKGGMISITNSLFRLAKELGVEFHFNQKVTTINTLNGKATGIMVDEKEIKADVVVSNSDVYFTYNHLLKQPAMAKKIEQLERSSSALIFYWGINKNYEELGLHNIFFTENYREEFRQLFKTKTLYHDPTVYINITAKMEPTHTPSGSENWFVMVNAPVDEGQDWKQWTKVLRKQVIEKLNSMLQTDLEQHIVTELVLDPVGISARTATYKGSLYGTSSNSPLSAFFRRPNFDKQVAGLYCCGGTVHPGGGIPLCLKSAAITASLIQEKHAAKQ